MASEVEVFNLEESTTSTTSTTSTSTFIEEPTHVIPSTSSSSLTTSIYKKQIQIKQLKSKLLSLKLKKESKIKLEEREKERDLTTINIQDRKLNLMQEIEEIKNELESIRDENFIKKNVLNSLNASHASNLYLSNTLEPSRQSTAFLEQSKLIQSRDNLSLLLLTKRNEIDLLLSQRTKIRKELLALNRSNAISTQGLTQTSIRNEIINSMSEELNLEFQSVQTILKNLSFRLTLIKNIFQLIVIESGIEWFDPHSSIDDMQYEDAEDEEEDEEAEVEEEDAKQMSRKELMRYMILAGDDATGDRELNSIGRKGKRKGNWD